MHVAIKGENRARLEPGNFSGDINWRAGGGEGRKARRAADGPTRSVKSRGAGAPHLATTKAHLIICCLPSSMLVNFHVNVCDVEKTGSTKPFHTRRT